MKHSSLGIALLVGSLYAATFAGADAAALPDATAAKKTITLQTTCPVMGGAVDKKLYVDHDGKRVYLCCQGCVAAVQKDPQKYIDKLEAAGVTVATLQTACPVMDQPIDKKLYVDHEGQRVYVCCPMCVAKFKADPEPYLKKMAAEGVALAKTPTPPAKPTVDAHAGHKH